jgi:Family of unknown function (DUF5754)
MKLISIKPSTKPEKKYMATFEKDNGRTKTTHFGAAGMDDYTKTHNKEQKERYLQRHKKNEHWNDPTSAGALSRYVLWNKPTVRESIADFKKHFNL